MDQNLTITIPSALYTRLQTTLHWRGLNSIEQLLEEWLTRDEELRQRQEAIRQINALREQLFAKYGKMPDCIELLREDRGR